MTQQPTFSTPAEAIAFIDTCLRQNDSNKLYSAFSEPTSDIWKDHLVEHLRSIQASESLESVFLVDGQITSFPEVDTTFLLGGHGLRTHHLNITLVKASQGWIFKSILMCR